MTGAAIGAGAATALSVTFTPLSAALTLAAPSVLAGALSGSFFVGVVGEVDGGRAN